MIRSVDGLVAGDRLIFLDGCVFCCGDMVARAPGKVVFAEVMPRADVVYLLLRVELCVVDVGVCEILLIFLGDLVTVEVARCEDGAAGLHLIYEFGKLGDLDEGIWDTASTVPVSAYNGKFLTGCVVLEDHPRIHTAACVVMLRIVLCAAFNEGIEILAVHDR